MARIRMFTKLLRAWPVRWGAPERLEGTCLLINGVTQVISVTQEDHSDQALNLSQHVGLRVTLENYPENAVCVSSLFWGLGVAVVEMVDASTFDLWDLASRWNSSIHRLKSD